MIKINSDKTLDSIFAFSHLPRLTRQGSSVWFGYRAIISFSCCIVGWKVKRLGRVLTSNFVIIKSDGNWLLLTQALFAMFASIVIDPTGPRAAERNSIFRLMESAKYAEERRCLASANEKCGAWKESSSARAAPFSSISDRYWGADLQSKCNFHGSL